MEYAPEIIPIANTPIAIEKTTKSVRVLLSQRSLITFAHLGRNALLSVHFGDFLLFIFFYHQTYGVLQSSFPQFYRSLARLMGMTRAFPKNSCAEGQQFQQACHC